jgi:hypothetical protein
VSIENENFKASFVGNGVTEAFSITFPVLDADHLKALLVDEDGVEEAFIDFSVTLTDGGATVTTDDPVEDGVTLFVYSDAPYTQETTFPDDSGFPEEVVEEALDKNTILTKQLKHEVDRAVKFKKSSASVAEVAEPSTGKALVWDAEGNLVNSVSTFDNVVAAAAASAAAALVSQNASAASATNASNSATAAANSQTAAANSATAALNSQNASATNATNAAGSATAAEGFKDQAEAAAVSVGIIQRDHVVLNNSAATNLTDETYDSAIYSSGILTLEIERNGVRWLEVYAVIFGGVDWGLYFMYGADPSQTDHGLTLTMEVGAVGQLKSAATNTGVNLNVKIKTHLFN